MYDKGIAGMGSAVATGAFSQVGTEIMWVFLGGFALFAAGLAFLRTLPRQQA